MLKYECAFFSSSMGWEMETVKYGNHERQDKWQSDKDKWREAKWMNEAKTCMDKAAEERESGKKIRGMR